MTHPPVGERIHPNLSLKAEISILPAGKIRKMLPSHEGERDLLSLLWTTVHPALPTLESKLTASGRPLHLTDPSAQLPVHNRRSVGFAAVESYLSVRPQRKFTPIASSHTIQMQSLFLKSCITCLLPAPHPAPAHIVSCLMSR